MPMEKPIGHTLPLQISEEDEDQPCSDDGFDLPKSCDSRNNSRTETIDYLTHSASAHSMLPPISEEKMKPPSALRRLSIQSATTANTKPDPEPELVYGFVELQILSGDGEISSKEWKQAARWIKYEEDLEAGSQRWGKPHVASLSFYSLFKLKQLIERDGLVMLDVEEMDMPGITCKVAEELTGKGLIRAEDSPLLMRMLLLNHKQVQEAEAGIWFRRRRSNTPNTPTSSTLNMNNISDSKYRKRSIADAFLRRNSTKTSQPEAKGLLRTSSGNFLKSLSNGAAADHVAVEIKGLNGNYSPSDTDLKLINLKEQVGRQLPQGAEATMIFVGAFDAIRRSVFLFLRLKEASFNVNVCEVPAPVRFVTIILVPPNIDVDLIEIGRAFGTLMSNKDFFEVAKGGVSRKSLAAGINEFLEESIVLPPGDWDNNDLLPLHILQLQSKNNAIRKRLIKRQLSFAQPQVEPQVAVVEPFDSESSGKKRQKYNPMERTGVPFGGVFQDACRRYAWYWSDIKDGLNFQCLATTLFMFCASVSQIITFAGLSGDKTGNLIGTSETIMVTAGVGVLYSCFSGQPLITLGPTGALLVFDEILYHSCTSLDIEFLPMRFWISIWLLLITIVVLFFEASVLAEWFTRFTQDIFAALISMLLIYESLANLIKIYAHHPLGTPRKYASTSLMYHTNDTTPDTILYEQTATATIIDESEDIRSQPNTALLSTLLMLGTFFIAYFLREFRHSIFLGERARRALGDFGVPIAVILMVLLDYHATDTYTRKMKVPSGLEPSDPDQRDWIVDIMGRETPFNMTFAILAFLPALLLFILIFMTTEICELIVNKEERKMVKGGGFHLDLLIMACLNVICGVFGGPWLCCATPRALAHVTALTVYSENHPPGEKPKIVEVKEQRLTNFALSILIGCSIALAPILQFIPLAVLYGVFLYIGVASLGTTQMWDRVNLLFIPPKQHPSEIYVRRVKTWKMHLYTVIQIGCLAFLLGVKSIKNLALAFPFLLMFLVPIRLQLKHIFQEAELQALDGEPAK